MTCPVCSRPFRIPERAVPVEHEWPIADPFPPVVLTAWVHGDCRGKA